MHKIPITKETENNLKKSIDLTIDFIAKSLDEGRNLLRKVSFLSDYLEKKNLPIHETVFEELNYILEYRMLIGIIYLDLASSTKAHLILESKYEKLFTLRQIVVIIIEGYKKICHFIHLNENGGSIIRDRKKSFWYKEIKSIVENSQNELTYEYNCLTEKLDNYYHENLSSIKEIRDLFVHYDKKASIVYDATLNLNIDKTFRKMSPFLGILNDMFLFTGKMAVVSNNIQNKKLDDFYNQINLTLKNLEDKIASHKT